MANPFLRNATITFVFYWICYAVFGYIDLLLAWNLSLWIGSERNNAEHSPSLGMICFKQVYLVLQSGMPEFIIHFIFHLLPALSSLKLWIFFSALFLSVPGYLMA